MAWTEKDVGNGIESDAAGENGFLKGVQLSSSNSVGPVKKTFEGKDPLTYANILRSRNRFADALAIYNSVVGKDNENVEAHIGKGICLQMQNMGRLAFESFVEAIRLDPENACALTHRGILYKDEGRLIEAAESYQKALNADPSYKPAAECLAIVLTDLGTSLKLAGNTQEGIQKYYEAIKTDPHYAPAYYNLGVVYSEMMQYDMALNCYEKAALEKPMYAEAYCNMGVIFKNRGDLVSAIACYERCLAVSPNFEIAKNNMAIALTDLGTKVKLEGDIDQGMEFYKKALYYNWHYADVMYNLGVAYSEMLKFDMIGFIGRLDYQKGIDIFLSATSELLQDDVQFVMLGSGEKQYEEWMRVSKSAFKDKYRGWVGFNVPISHCITAGCDILLMPSRLEPCGVNQLYAMRYGTIPVVHGTGGLKDTVKTFNAYAQEGSGEGTGWLCQLNLPYLSH